MMANCTSSVSAKKPILIVLHQETSTPGRIGHILLKRGFPLDIRRPVFGQSLPSTLADYSGAIVFGGPMSANDNDAFVHCETQWMAVPLRENKPLLGICLGAQLLVNHLGGTVAGRKDGRVEIGWYDLEPTDEGRKLLAWPDKVYQFHREGFSLPSGAVHLAQSESYPNQAFRYGENAWAIQFHAELTLAMMHRWSVRGAHRFVLPDAQPGALHLAGRWAYDGALLAWLEQFLTLVFEAD